tara:strand:+ start:209 stop:1744 length:1536 start_codon:yes stop_codon:yes gene_type:complete
MTVKFCFGNARKDGAKNLKIRLKSKGRDKKISIPGVYINPKNWDTPNNRVKSKCQNANAYNEIVVDYQKKILKVKGQLELKQIDFDTAYRVLSNSSSTNSIFEFIKIHCEIKGKRWINKNLKILETYKNHLKLSDVTFEDITYDNIQKLKKVLIERDTVPETYNNYLRHIRALYNFAITKKITYREFNFSKDLFIKVNSHNKKLLTHTPEDISEAIDKIKIKSNLKSSKEYALRDLEAIGFWLLQFSMRGLYGKDITSLTSYDSDYNYKYRIKYLSENAHQEPMEIKGAPQFIDHKRHKTGNMMRIWVTLPPIGGLIFILKRLVANTHPNLSYLSKEDLLKAPEELYSKKNYDIIKIFKHTTDELEKDDALWNNLNKHLRKLGLYSFQSARKSFNTTATHLRIPPDLRKTLLGQTDKSIQRSYNNYNDIRLVKDIQESHLQVMCSFKLVELFDKWVFKINELFGVFENFHVGGGSKLVYSHQYEFLKEFLNDNKTLIDNVDLWGEFLESDK